jgi:hypothetical protein
MAGTEEQRLARPRVLALPSATAWRGAVLLVTLLSAGLFAGSAVHHETGPGGRWASQLTHCLARHPFGPSQDLGSLVSNGAAFIRCTAAVNTTLTLFQLAGAAAAVAGGLLLTGLAPAWVIRTRRLRAAGPGLAACSAAVARLARDLGMRRAPRLYLGPAQQRDAFSFGLPGWYALALPPALAIRSGDAALFDPVVRHELAHLKHHDVLLAWSARAARWVLVPVLLVPAGLMAAAGDDGVLPAYLWRAALLALSGVLVAAGLLRSREFEADLGSALSAEQRASLGGVLESGAAAPHPRGRRLLVLHPSAAGRVQVLAEPWLAARVTGWDGFAVALLAALAAPLVSSLLADSPALYRWATVSGPVTAGALFGITLGLATWRDALARSVAGQPAARSWPLTVGVLAGYALGQTASLAQVGSPGLAGFPSSWSVLITPLAAASAAMLTLALAAVLAGAAAALPRPALVACALVLSSAVPATVLWMAGLIQLAAGSGWPLVRVTLVSVLGPWPEVVSAGVLALLLLGLLAAGRQPAVPAWFLDAPAGAGRPGQAGPGGIAPGPPAPPYRPLLAATLLTALASGIAGGVALAVFRWISGPPRGPADALQRLDAWYWVFALSGAAAAVALAARYGRRGLAAGLAAAPLASCLTALITTGVNTALGGDLTLAFTTGLIRPGLGLGIALVGTVALLAAAAGMIRRPVPAAAAPPAAVQPAAPATTGRRRLRPAATALLAVALCVPLATLALASRESYSPLSADAQSLGVDPGLPPGPDYQPSAEPTEPMQAEALAYRLSFVPQMAQQLTGLDQTRQIIQSNPHLSPHARAVQIKTLLAQTAQEMLYTAQQLHLRTSEVRAAHAHLIQGLILTITSYQDDAVGYLTGSTALLAKGRTRLAQAHAHFRHWQEAVSDLH